MALTFTNRFTTELPGDPDTTIRPRQVHGACWSPVRPRPAAAPQLLAHSREVAEELELDLDVDGPDADWWAEVLTGTTVPDGADPYAACYGGHQFGSWAGQLGDGRAIALGEIVTSRGDHHTLQLKGAGRTPYSRTADGLAVLRSSVREFLCSEAMHHLGVPTTRALSLALTGETVVRDMFYDGNPAPEPGAVVCRVAPSFTRFGNFEIFAARGEHEVLARLADFTIRTDFPELGEPSPEVIAEFFAEVVRRTADLMVDWMRLGFVHGVMNTDNMSITGLTIDYGPYGWLEDYDPMWTPNTTDAGGRRYRYGAQPEVALWNLVRLANALYPLVGRPDPLTDALDTYGSRFEQRWQEAMAAKLGLESFDPATDTDLVDDLGRVLVRTETDMTIFHRDLADVPVTGERSDAADVGDADDATVVAPLGAAWYRPDEVTGEVLAELAGWVRRYQARVRRDGTPDQVRAKRMDSTNPRYVLRNYLAQLAIDQATAGDPGLVHELLDVLRHPYDDQPGRERFAEKRPEWARDRPGCSMLSCSS